MSKEMLLVVEAMANEKSVSRSVVYEALESALASAAKKTSGDEIAARVSINRNTGVYETFRRWEIVADDVRMENPQAQIRLMDALDIQPDAQIGLLPGGLSMGQLLSIIMIVFGAGTVLVTRRLVAKNTP